MKFVDVRKYVTGLLSASFINKSILDNLAEDENENLTYKGAVIKGNGSSGTVVVDDKLDLKSENPVQNKVIAASLNGIDTLLDYILGNEIETSNVYKIFDGVGIGEGGALE